ncbi:hypothetical protein [Agathobaculum sp. Marseille-P7918]|uniref:hypothetical protein n=1 Tax=Agathobaculum sp. Marseille-P7918 TaxID=2479843 RepID=UPI000F633779|nr:hypothetical protein [Agathobaculum sp. Marseille-P7918]
MLQIVNHEKIITNAFPMDVMRQMSAGINLAYSCADQLVDGNEILNWTVGREFLGYFRNIAVEFQLKRLIETTNCGLSYRLAPNRAHNYQHVEILSQDCVMTISQVHSKYAYPREAKYRNALASNNQIIFNEFQENDDDVINHYLILTHGTMRNELWQEPDFIGIGYPTAECNGWNAFLDLTTCDNDGLIIEDSSLKDAEAALKIELETAIATIKNA